MNWRGHCPHSAAIDQASNLRERTNMSKHTQGPWEVEHADENVFDIVPDDSIGGTVAIAYDEGNAKLIAAAPEMRKWLEKLVEEDGILIAREVIAIQALLDKIDA